MKRDVDQLRRAAPGVDERVIAHHVERLEDAYFERFEEAEVAEHLRCLSRLSGSHPVEVLVAAGEAEHVACTVVALDYPSEFSLITGVLAGLGFSIATGDVFTYSPASESASSGGSAGGGGRWRRRRSASIDPMRRRRIIDHFVGELDGDVTVEQFEARLREELAEVIGLLESDPRQGLAAARHRVNEMVTQRLSRLSRSELPRLYPIQIDIGVPREKRTYLRITAQDTPAFLYALSNALSLMGMSIERVRINTVGERVEDEIGFVDRRGEPVTDPDTLDRVRLVVLLTKQFTYYLDKSPDPYTALSRFEQMVDDLLRREQGVDWLELLSDPRSMQNLARLLGASDYLWEDFIRLQYEALRPILEPELAGESAIGPPTETVGERLRAAIEAAATPSEKRKALNRFKDAEVFRIDLDHILRPEVDFRELARRLTALAEAVVEAAAGLAYDRLVEQYGEPRLESGARAKWAVFGLGKLGGAALGYASDIELLFVYEGPGMTETPGGGQTIANGEFFNLLAREVNGSIEAKQEGIFRVDLRLRPYGKNAPLAVSRETFEKYYDPAGDSHSFERLALVRMRAVAGDAAFGQQVCDLRDALVYEREGAIDLEELWEMRRMQWQQKRSGAAFNAKYAPGALADVEYAAQILQVRYGGKHRALRTPRVHEALAALREAGVLGGDEAQTLERCYDFMRVLINGLRMLRGSAQDLDVPAAESSGFRYLARRMGYEDGQRLTAEQQLQCDLLTRAAEGRAVVRRLFGGEALPDETFGNLADVVLTPDLPRETAVEMVRRSGLGEAEGATDAARALAVAVTEPAARARLARPVVLAAYVARAADVAGVLAGWRKRLAAGETVEALAGLPGDVVPGL
jgi:glutamate-ammonia-ligase adenylyltransferase